MAAKTFWFYDVAVNGFGKLDEGSQPSQVATTTIGSWTINVGATSHDRMIYGSTVVIASGDGNVPAAPASGNSLRSLNPITGSFASGTWTFTFQIVDSINNALVDTQFACKLYKGTAADGSNAALFYASQFNPSPFHTASTTITAVNAATGAVGAATFTNEYLFISLAYEVDNSDVVGRTGTTTLYQGSTKLVTPNFVALICFDAEYATVAAALNARLGQTFRCGANIVTPIAKPLATFNVSLSESLGLAWGVPGEWGTAVWGGGSAELFAAAFNSGVALSETGAATDALDTSAVFPTPLTEAGTATDALAQSIAMSATVSESGSASDAIEGSLAMSAPLFENPTWGETGLRWGDTLWGPAFLAADTESAVQVFANPVTEAGTALDVLSTSGVFPTPLTEAGTALDVLVQSIAMSAAVSEAGSSTDSMQAVQAFVSPIFENPSWGETGLRWGDVFWGAGFFAADTESAVQNFSCPLAETGAATDAAAASAAFPNTLTESGAATDSAVPSLGISFPLSESGAATDSLAAAWNFAGTLIESGAATDVYGSVAAFQSALSESGLALDSIVVGTTIAVAIAEALNAADMYGGTGLQIGDSLCTTGLSQAIYAQLQAQGPNIGLADASKVQAFAFALASAIIPNLTGNAVPSVVVNAAGLQTSTAVGTPTGAPSVGQALLGTLA